MADHRQPPESQASRYFDDEVWPVQLSVAALGALLIGLCFVHRPTEGAVWLETSWPLVNSIGIATILAAIAVSFVDARWIRRPLQLALALCVVLHAVLVAQMVHSKLQTGASVALVPNRQSSDSRRPKLMAEYRPVAHLPDESRPVQDFERPVESETPLAEQERQRLDRKEIVPEPAPAVETPQVEEKQAKPEAIEVERKLADPAPAAPSAEASQPERSLAAEATSAAREIELPKAEREMEAPAPAAQAVESPVARRAVAAAPEAATASSVELSREPRETAEQPKDLRRKLPVYQPAVASNAASEPTEAARRMPVSAADVELARNIELPAVAQAVVEQAVRDHAPVATKGIRSKKSNGAATGTAGATSPEITGEIRVARASPTNVLELPARTKGTSANEHVEIAPSELATVVRPARPGQLPRVAAPVVPLEAFSGRAARLRGGERNSTDGKPPESEETIERGLVFLARQQRLNGSWSLQGFPEEASLVSDTAATALALLAFQGAGYNHREAVYKDVVAGGLGYLIAHQKANGDLFEPLEDSSNRSVWLYSHALATIVLCEAYGMTQDPALREPAQKGMDFIVEAQQAERGGWRYAPGVGADTSVSGWMTMALKSGELAGLSVSPNAYLKISRWLDAAQQSPSTPYLYSYNPYAPDTPEQRHGRAASKTMTAVGLLMRLYTGWRRDDPNFTRGAVYLSANFPVQGTARQNERDTYYWYYATQVMAQHGGERWQTWTDKLHPLLVNSQVRRGAMSGSWDPLLPIADRWGPQAGRLYVTAMNLLSLEVEYRGEESGVRGQESGVRAMMSAVRA
jgi:hypothetical protein